MTDFYQSPGDKLRLEVLLKTLSDGSLNLAILGEDDVVLAHYARRIAQHLRQHGNIEVELWTSTDSEKLVKRFNEILSEVSVDQALDKAQKAATKRYMIFPDAQGIQDIDLQLLARLVNGFPASNIHVVLLVNSLEPHERKLEAFGKSLMQWVLESENPAPKRTQRIETLDEVLPEPAPGPTEPPIVPSPLLDAVPTLQEAAPAVNSWDTPAAPDKKGGARLGWGLFGVMLVTLVLFGLLYKEQIQTEVEAMQGYLSRTGPGKAKEPATNATPSVGMSSTTQLPVKPDDSLIPEKEALVKPEPVPATVPAPASTPAVAVAPVAAPVPEPKPEPKADPKPEPVVANGRDDKAWVEKLPAGGWMLQHAAFDTQQEIELLQSKQASFKEARVLKTKRKSGASYFILVTGPYATRQEAENLIKTDPAMAKSWLRATKSVKNQFQD